MDINSCNSAVFVNRRASLRLILSYKTAEHGDHQPNDVYLLFCVINLIITCCV